MIKKLAPLCALMLGAGVTLSVATARLPAPSDEAKVKAAEAAAKSAHAGKVDNFKLCQSMNNVAAKYATQAKAAGKTVTPIATPECADPGPYVSPTAAAAAPAAPAGAAPAAVASAATPAKAAMPAAAAAKAVAPAPAKKS